MSHHHHSDSVPEVAEQVAVPPAAANAALEDLEECEQEQRLSRAEWAAHVGKLWGPEPAYDTQAEDRSGAVYGALLYGWMGEYIFQASREELTENSLPRPTRVFRAYDSGVRVSAQMQEQQLRRHAWDGFVGARVGVRWDAASEGVLRWVGVVQRYGTPRQLYAGVEWRVAPVQQRRGGVLRRWLRCGGCAGVERGPGAFHRGDVDGECLFDLAEPDTVASCERVQDVVFRLDEGGSGDEVPHGELPSSLQEPPQPVQVWWTVSLLFRGNIVALIFLGLLMDASRLVQPLLLRWFVAYLTLVSVSKNSNSSSDVSQSHFDSLGSYSSLEGDGIADLDFTWADVFDSTCTAWQRGVFLALLMFAAVIIGTIASNKMTHLQRRCALQVRNALSALMFEKMFTMSSKAMHHPAFNSGRVANMMSSDLGLVSHFIMMFWRLLSAPHMLAISFFQLYLLVGKSIFAGGLVVLFSAPLQTIVMRGLSSLFRSRAMATDQRLKATNELFAGIRVVKFMSWEPSFLARIEDNRGKEIYFIKKVQTSFMAIFFLFNAAPGFVIAAVFFTFSFSGHRLTPEIVFPAISLFRMLTSFVAMLPFVANMVIKLFVSLRRLNTFFESEDDLVNPIEDIEDLQAPTNTADSCETAAAAYVHAAISTFTVEELSKDLTATPAALGEPAHPPLHSASDNAPEPTEDSPSGLLAEDAETETGASNVTDDPAPVTPTSTAYPQLEYKEDALYVLRAKTLLADVDVAIPRGRLTVVLGPTGSGKSTLLDALIGALAVTRGRVACSRCVAYVPQQPWIMNATLRENVVFFGSPDAAAFERAVASSQLAADLALLADGAETEIGEKGINLSGGQKARVSLARAVYADRDVYLLDDPLSALDAHVGERVMRECVLGALAGKTRVLATHQVHVARDADYVVVLAQGGRVAFQGIREAYFHNYLAHDMSISTDAQEAATVAPADAVAAPTVEPLIDGGSAAGAVRCSADKAAGRLMTEEERFRGAVPLSTYLRYMRACGGMWVCGGVVALYLATEVLVLAPSIWLALWSTTYFSLTSAQYSVAYVVLSLLGALSGPLRYWVSMTVMRRASYVVHRDLLRSVSCATLSFFDTTPLGRLISRFTNDIGNIDNDLQNSYSQLMSTVASFLSTVVTMVATQVLVVAVLVPCMCVYYFLLRFYARANRELKRLVNVVNTPVLSVLEETFGGRWTIQAYGVAPAVLRKATRCADVVFTCSYLQLVAQLWLSVRIQMLSTSITLAVALGAVVAVHVAVLPAHVGLLSLSLTLALELSGILDGIISVLASVEADMNSVERIYHMADTIEHEDLRAAVAMEVDAIHAGHALPASEGASNDGEFGTLELAHVDMRYRPGLPLVLRDVCFAVAPGEKVGVVGRTGSGKSTLLLAFLRLVEVCGGAMRVCGRDARDYGVRELRQLFSMIPQDPLLFDGTVRSNVDPFGACGDAGVWGALRQVGMEERVRGEAGGLDGRVQEGGSNFSVGQRQLLCLARALLKRGSAFLLMDEATANVDPALDRQIQRTVQHAFRDHTVVTIAHRLHTVASYDKILVMDGGRAVEYGAPRALLEREGSAFGALVHSMGRDARSSFLRALKEHEEVAE